jgi:hypothetical protein
MKSHVLNDNHLNCLQIKESEEGRGKVIVISWTSLRDCIGMRAKDEEKNSDIMDKFAGLYRNTSEG